MNDEQHFSELMRHGRLKMPFSDFEERTMARIHREQQVQAASRRYRKLSWMFFVLGAILGALATGFVTALPLMSSGSLALGCQLCYVVLLLAALNYLLRSKSTSPNNPLS
jgi:hypothetical protein